MAPGTSSQVGEYLGSTQRVLYERLACQQERRWGDNPDVAKQVTVRLDCRVLLAEDGPDNQRLISFVLKKAGADVTVAENGLIGLDLALKARGEGNPFEVIPMDMQMPVMDGYTATSKLREADYPGPIIALTAHAMSDDRQKCWTPAAMNTPPSPLTEGS